MSEVVDKKEESAPFRPGTGHVINRPNSLGAAAHVHSDGEAFLAEIRYLEQVVEERAKRELGPDRPLPSAYRVFNL